MKYALNLAMIVLITVASLQVAAEPQWFKGNTHTHTLWSDGNNFPDMVALWFRDNGYNFLVLTDHNVLSQSQRWMGLADIEKRGAKDALPMYLERLGEDWVETRGEGADKQVRLKTLPEVKKLVETDSFIMIQGEEITDGPVHTNAINLGKLVPPPGGSDVRDRMRNAIRAVRKQADELQQPILPHLNHPNFGWAITAEDIAHVTEEEFYEVYNGHPSVGHRGDQYHVSIERMWDIANTIRVGKLASPPLYGVATDDSHQYFEGQNVTPGRGWIMVWAESLQAADLLHSMRHGSFYSTSGVLLKDFDYKDGQYSVEVEPQGDAEYTIEFIGTLKGYDDTVVEQKDSKGKVVTGKYSDDVGKVLKTVKGTSATYEMTGNELYVRARVTSSEPPANPVFRGQKAEAWLQPFGWEKHIDAEVAEKHFRLNEHHGGN